MTTTLNQTIQTQFRHSAHVRDGECGPAGAGRSLSSRTDQFKDLRRGGP